MTTLSDLQTAKLLFNYNCNFRLNFNPMLIIGNDASQVTETLQKDHFVRTMKDQEQALDQVQKVIESISQLFSSEESVGIQNELHHAIDQLQAAYNDSFTGMLECHESVYFSTPGNVNVDEVGASLAKFEQSIGKCAEATAQMQETIDHVLGAFTTNNNQLMDSDIFQTLCAKKDKNLNRKISFRKRDKVYNSDVLLDVAKIMMKDIESLQSWSQSMVKQTEAANNTFKQQHSEMKESCQKMSRYIDEEEFEFVEDKGEVLRMQLNDVMEPILKNLDEYIGHKVPFGKAQNKKTIHIEKREIAKLLRKSVSEIMDQVNDACYLNDDLLKEHMSDLNHYFELARELNVESVKSYKNKSIHKQIAKLTRPFRAVAALIMNNDTSHLENVGAGKLGRLIDESQVKVIMFAESANDELELEFHPTNPMNSQLKKETGFAIVKNILKKVFGLSMNDGYSDDNTSNMSSVDLSDLDSLKDFSLASDDCDVKTGASVDKSINEIDSPSIVHLALQRADDNQDDLSLSMENIDGLMEGMQFSSGSE